MVIAAVYDDNAACRAALSKLAGATNLIEVFPTGHYKVARFAPLDSRSVILCGENTRLLAGNMPLRLCSEAYVSTPPSPSP